MATDVEVDYDQMVTQANAIALNARHVYEEVKKAYDEVGTMMQYWFGNSYDLFVTSCNLAIEQLNNIFRVTINDVPMELYAKAKSYAAVNQEDISVSYTEQTIGQLEELAKSNKGGQLRFQESNVKSCQSNIKTYFENAKSYADDAKAEAEKVSWKSIGGTSNINAMKNAFSRLNSNLNGLKTVLDTQITVTTTTTNAADAAMDAIEAAPQVVEDALDSAKETIDNVTSQIEESASKLWQQFVKNATGTN